MLQKPKLKEARYKCWGYGWGPEFPEYNKIVYVIIDDRCYFSGVEKDVRTSTINAAESIIKAISEQENIPIAKLRWFDLVTYTGYKQKPGEYDLKELELGPSENLVSKGREVTPLDIDGEIALLFSEAAEDFTVASWRHSVLCPKEVLEIFRNYIGADFYSKSTDVLGIPSRICSRLKDAGIKTVAELICVRWSELRKILADNEISTVDDELSKYKLFIEEGLYHKEFINKLSGGTVCT